MREGMSDIASPRSMVVLDFDSTIADSMDSLYANQHHWNDGDPIEMDLSHWDIIDGYDQRVQQRLWSYFHSDIGISHVTPKTGAIRTINALMDNDVFVLVLTDRKPDSYPALYRWFDDHGLVSRFDAFAIDITHGNVTKQDVLRLYLDNDAFDVVAVIDDAPHHLERYSDVYGNFTVYSFRYPYNTMQIDKGLAMEIETWDEFEREIREELARRATA